MPRNQQRNFESIHFFSLVLWQAPLSSSMASYNIRTGSGPLKTLPFPPAKRPAPQPLPPSPTAKAPPVKQPLPTTMMMISTPSPKQAPQSSPPPRSPTTLGSIRPGQAGPLSPYGPRPTPKNSHQQPISEQGQVPRPAPPPARPIVQQAPHQVPSTVAPPPPPPPINSNDGPDSFPIDEEALLQAEAEAERKAKMSKTGDASTIAPAPAAPSSAQVPTPPAAPAVVMDETLRLYQQEISALKYKLQIREQENEKTRQELRARHNMYTEAEKKVTQLSAQLAFKNQELHDMEFISTTPTTTTTTATAAVATGEHATTSRDVKMTNAGVAHPEEGSESQKEATDLEEAIEDPRDGTLSAQRFKVGKNATQRSPQKKKPRASAPVLAITPSSAEKKRRAPDNEAAPDVVDLKRKLRACTSRLQSVKRALNGEFDAAVEASSPLSPAAPIDAVNQNATLSKEVALLREQLALREELFRQQEEAYKVDAIEKEAAIAAMKRMEQVIINAEQTMKSMDAERAKLLSAVQELKNEAQKIADERLEAVRALSKAEKENESLNEAMKEVKAMAATTEEKLAATMLELQRVKQQNEELGNECAVAKASREVEMRRATKAEKECEESRTRLLSMEQRCAEASKQIHDDALKIAHLRRQHATELAEQRALFDEQLKKLAPLPHEQQQSKRELFLGSSNNNDDDEREQCSAPM